MPVMRPVFLEYPAAQEFYGDDRDFLFGSDFFVAPVVSETADAHGVSLPPGEWHDYWTAVKHTSKDKINLHPRLDEAPLYVRAVPIVPLQPVVQFTGDKPNGTRALRVYPPNSPSGQHARGT